MNELRKRQLILIGVVFCLVLGIDQATKAVVRAKIPYGSVPVQDKFFYFTHERNTGLVGGAFHDNPLVAFTAPVVATLVLLYLYRHLEKDSRVQALAYGLIAGGAAGNLIDRFRLGWVTDFLQFYFAFLPEWFVWRRYPAFNVADSGICIGVALLLISWFAAGRKHVAETA